MLSLLHCDANAYTTKLSQVTSKTEVAQQPCCEQYQSLDANAYEMQEDCYQIKPSMGNSMLIVAIGEKADDSLLFTQTL